MTPQKVVGKTSGVPASERATRVWTTSAVAALAGLLFGFDTAVINGALIFLKQDLRLSDVQVETAASALLLGALLGSALVGAITDRFGRRRVLMGAALLFCAASVWTALPSHLAGFLAARLVTGLAIGVASVLAPMYIGEIAPPKMRGRLVTLNQMAIVTGILVSYFINWGFSGLGAGSWRWMFAVGVVPSIVFLVGLLRIPESPRWLLSRGRREPALAILRSTLDENEAVREVRAIEASIAAESRSFGELLTPDLRRRLMVGVGLCVLQQITGINTMIYYGALLLREHGGQSGAGGALAANIMIGVVNFLGTIVAILLIDRVGRRPLLLAGGAGMGASLLLLSFAFRRAADHPGLVLLPVLAYIAAFAVSFGPGAWLYISEIFPTAVRGRAMSIATLCLWGACMLVTITFLTMLNTLGPEGTFRVYALFCGFSVIFVWFLVPETKGRTLEEIAAKFRR